MNVSILTLLALQVAFVMSKGTCPPPVKCASNETQVCFISNCTKCICQPKCPIMRACPKHCKVKRDKNYCAVDCECSEDHIGFSSGKCPRKMCKKRCIHGYRRNAKGCILCLCKRPGRRVKCPKRRCRKRCKFGYMKTRRGCTMCRCKKLRPRKSKKTARSFLSMI